MASAAVTSRFVTAPPSRPLRAFISHYWLSLDNRDATHTVLPDGTVDLVVSRFPASARSWVYGSATSRIGLALEQRCHYLGVRFKPGQSRHFIDAAADELTDRCEPAEGLLLFPFDGVPESVVNEDIFACLNTLFEHHLAGREPAPSGIDRVVALIEATHGTTRIDEAAASFGKSRRQFERVFLETVGVSAKFFSSVTRFRRAAALMQRPFVSLADIAFESGYSDQSHMSHEFRRLANVSPATYARSRVAFLQDQPPPSSENGPFPTTLLEGVR